MIITTLEDHWEKCMRCYKRRLAHNLAPPKGADSQKLLWLKQRIKNQKVTRNEQKDCQVKMASDGKGQ